MIMSMMEISTAHIKEQTSLFLNDEDRINDVGMIVYKKEDCGWFIWISGKLERDYGNKEIPEDLWECMVYAWESNCDWLVLDHDGEVDEYLETYEWED